MRFGIGLALTPIPQAQAPAFRFVAGPIPATTYLCAGELGFGTAGQEGAPSDATTYDAPANSLAVVNGGESTGGGDGIQRVYGIDRGRDDAPEFVTDSGGTEFHFAAIRVWWRAPRREMGRPRTSTSWVGRC